VKNLDIKDYVQGLCKILDYEQGLYHYVHGKLINNFQFLRNNFTHLCRNDDFGNT